MYHASGGKIPKKNHPRCLGFTNVPMELADIITEFPYDHP